MCGERAELRMKRRADKSQTRRVRKEKKEEEEWARELDGEAGRGGRWLREGEVDKARGTCGASLRGSQAASRVVHRRRKKTGSGCLTVWDSGGWPWKPTSVKPRKSCVFRCVFRGRTEETNEQARVREHKNQVGLTRTRRRQEAQESNGPHPSSIDHRPRLDDCFSTFTLPHTQIWQWPTNDCLCCCECDELTKGDRRCMCGLSRLDGRQVQQRPIFMLEKRWRRGEAKTNRRGLYYYYYYYILPCFAVSRAVAIGGGAKMPWKKADGGSTAAAGRGVPERRAGGRT